MKKLTKTISITGRSSYSFIIRVFFVCLAISMLTILSQNSSATTKQTNLSQKTLNNSKIDNSLNEKAQLEQAVGASLNKHFYDYNKTEKAQHMDFKEYWHKRTIEQKKTGLILAAVVAPVIASLTIGISAGLIAYGYHYYHNDWGSLLYTMIAVGAGFTGAIITFPILISGLVVFRIANKRLSKTKHLFETKPTISQSTQWSLKCGLGGLSFGCRF